MLSVIVGVANRIIKFFNRIIEFSVRLHGKVYLVGTGTRKSSLSGLANKKTKPKAVPVAQ